MVTVSNTSLLFNLAIIDRLVLVGKDRERCQKRPTAPHPDDGRVKDGRPRCTKRSLSALLECEVNGFRLGVVLHGFKGRLSTNAGLLVSTKRLASGEIVVAIDPDVAGL